jgi:hypothetical protein
MLRTNSEAQLEPDGLHTLPPYLLITTSHGVSSVLLSTHITCLWQFLDLEQGNHNVFDYTRQFNTIAQYRSYHVNTDEKKANLYHTRLTIHLQERLGQFTSLSYNELASAAIDQERLMNAVAEADEKKRKRMMPRSSARGGCSGAPPKYHIVYIPTGG